MVSLVFYTVLLTILILLPTPTTAQPYRNVTLGSSIFANDSSSTWISRSGEFAFGFQQMAAGGGYLLAIWFDKIPEKTIVWSANRNNPVEKGSKIQLFADGRFELNDPGGQPVWAAKLERSGIVAYGAMLDSGNFVLASNASAVEWQSFDDPTDTLLPSQILNRGSSLVSSFSERNYSMGRFMFILQNDGNLMSYTRNFPMNDTIFEYWWTGTAGSGFQLIFNQSGYIFLIAENGTIVNSVSSNGASTSQFYQRAILEYDGVFRHYVYPKSANSVGGRPMAWSVVDFLPSNICLRVGGDTGWGACGPNSLCSLGTDQRPSCRCPVGYSQIDRNDRMSGCKPDFIPQNCDQESQETHLFSFIDMPNSDWPGSDSGYFQQVSEDWCRQSCLVDCFCAAAVYRNNLCWKKKYPLSNGRNDPILWEKALLKIRNNATSNIPDSNPTSNKCNRSTSINTILVLLGSLVFLLLLALLLLFAMHLKGKKAKNLQPHSNLPGVNVRSYSFSELQEATNGFLEELGKGAFSTVYKGALKNENGKIVAVKKLEKIATEAEQEFKAEVSSISRTNHKNLVQLLGYCDEGQHRLLVYEFMSNGSLARFLFKNSRPSWYRREQIAYAIARGLCYLHEDCSTPIIHCDIKPQNVLLDEPFAAKISDFGLAKLLRPDQTRTTTGIRGTRGYLAPEWFRNMPITVKVDVYSFGILLLELLCCRKNVETDIKEENEAILADWAYDCYKSGAIKLLIGKDQEAMDDIKQVEKFLKIAIWCIQEDPSLRPNMKRVMLMLEAAVEVPIPPNPAPY